MNPDRGCFRKVRYNTVAEADQAIVEAKRERPDTYLRHYACPHCRYLHLTSQPSRDAVAEARGGDKAAADIIEFVVKRDKPLSEQIRGWWQRRRDLEKKRGQP